MSNTQENDRLIARFMGMKGTDIFLSQNYLYHSDWSRLMPVVERIASIPIIGAVDNQDVCYPRTFGMPHTDGKIMVRFNGFSLHYGDTLLEAIYEAVVEAVEILNTQNKPNEPSLDR